MTRPPYRFCLSLFLLALPMAAAAVGLGEVRGQPVLGERLRLEIDILGSERRPIDASCFRLIPPPGGDDLPWLKQATFSVRGGAVPVLEIRSTTALRDPILQLGVQLGCGYEISRQYMLLAQAASGADNAPAATASAAAAAPPAEPRPPRRPARPSATAGEEAPPVRKAPRRALPPSPPADRLTLSGGGETGLRMAVELASLNGGLSASEAQREMLRLEFRMLMVLNEQATTQLATAEKLRNMEALLGDLQSRAGDFAARVERGGAAVVAVPPVAPPAAMPAAPAAAVKRPALSEWSFYGLLLGLLLGLGGWFAWRNYRQRGKRPSVENYALPAAGSGATALPAAGASMPVDLSVEPALAHAATTVDVELDGGDAAAAEEVPVLQMQPRRPAALEAATVDEHFEANPVMELADIMLSFGRVKGAAQALQEYIDSNPDEALQPWIRLMDVYRMAGMQAEFEQVARNLNQHFNVAVQHWDGAAVTAAAAPAGAAAVQTSPHPAAAPESLEEMPRLMAMVCDLWADGDVVGYLYQLLRDNRGGKRLGFALPVVEEILFLIELKETSNRIEQKEDKS